MTRLQELLRRTTSGAAWMPEIDGLRFVAILPVVLQHMIERYYRYTQISKPAALFDDPLAFFISRGTVGVFLFFAISGFVLALPFGKSVLQNRPAVPLKPYYFRRLTRIEPPYLIWMTVFAAVLLAKGTYVWSEMLPHWLATVTYTHNLIYHDYTRINPVAWSLEVEIQFYLIAPFLANAYFRISKVTLRRVGILAFMVLAISLQTYSGGPIPFWLKASILGQLQHFLIGFLLCDLFLNEWKPGTNRHWVWDILALTGFVVMCYTWTSEYWKSLVFDVALFFLFAGAFKGVLYRKFLQNTWIAITGGMCYTIYLTHLPLLEGLMQITNKIYIPGGFWVNYLLQLVFCLPFIWVASAIFFVWTEKPFMQKQFPLPAWGRRALHRLQQMAGFFLVLLILWFHPTDARAQNDSLKTNLYPRRDSLSPLLDLKLRPFEELCALALQKNPEIKAKQLDMERQALAISIQKRSVGELLSFNLSGLYGNGSSLDANSGVLGTTYVLTDRKQTGFNANVSIKINGADILTRGKKTQMARLQGERLLEELEGIKNDVRKMVISSYYQLATSLQMVKSKSEAVESARIILSVAEKYFREGNITVAEYGTVRSAYNNARESLITAQLDAEQQAVLLRELVGGDIWKR